MRRDIAFLGPVRRVGWERGTGTDLGSTPRVAGWAGGCTRATGNARHRCAPPAWRNLRRGAAGDGKRGGSPVVAVGAPRDVDAEHVVRAHADRRRRLEHRPVVEFSVRRHVPHRSHPPVVVPAPPRPRRLPSPSPLPAADGLLTPRAASDLKYCRVEIESG